MRCQYITYIVYESANFIIIKNCQFLICIYNTRARGRSYHINGRTTCFVYLYKLTWCGSVIIIIIIEENRSVLLCALINVCVKIWKWQRRRERTRRESGIYYIIHWLNWMGLVVESRAHIHSRESRAREYIARGEITAAVCARVRYRVTYKRAPSAGPLLLDFAAVSCVCVCVPWAKRDFMCARGNQSNPGRRESLARAATTIIWERRRAREGLFLRKRKKKQQLTLLLSLYVYTCVVVVVVVGVRKIYNTKRRKKIVARVTFVSCPRHAPNNFGALWNYILFYTYYIIRARAKRERHEFWGHEGRRSS